MLVNLALHFALSKLLNLFSLTNERATSALDSLSPARARDRLTFLQAAARQVHKRASFGGIGEKRGGRGGG